MFSLFLLTSACTLKSQKPIANNEINNPVTSSDEDIISDLKNDLEETSSPNKLDPVACPADAKQCPDGSYVGRTGPKCEFATCPAVKKEFCSCPDGYYLEGEACNPNCYKNIPQCLRSSIKCVLIDCGECPMLTPPSPSFCPSGKIIAGEKNECGCQGPPKCEIK